MVLDGQCSCSGVITVSGKAHHTKNRTSTFKRSFQTVSLFSNSFQLRREEQHLITASLAYERMTDYTSSSTGTAVCRITRPAPHATKEQRTG